MNVPVPARNTGRWLVLGAAGFIGRAMLAELKAGGHATIGAGRSSLIGHADWQKIDVFDAASLRDCLRHSQPSVIVNATAPTANIAPTAQAEFCVRGTRLLLEAVQSEVPACRVLLLGSAAEYGNSPDACGSSETDRCLPLSDYGRAKVEQFSVANRFAEQGLNIITARLFNPIGPGQGRHQLVGALLDRIRRGERPLRVSHGNHIRDWVDVRDVARALFILGETPNLPTVVNVCTGQGQPVEFIARTMARLAGVPVEVIPGEISPEILWRSVGNPERLFQFGWRPQVDLVQSLADEVRLLV